MELTRVVALVVAAVEYRAQMASGLAKAESPRYLRREDEAAMRALLEAARAVTPGDVTALHRLMMADANGGGAR